MSNTVEYKGNKYEMDALYSCAETGRIGVLKGFESKQDHPFVMLHQERNATTSIPCIGLVEVPRKLGTITKAPIKLKDGEYYSFDNPDLDKGYGLGIFIGRSDVIRHCYGQCSPDSCTNIVKLVPEAK